MAPPRSIPGIVIVQVNEITGQLPRVDIPGSWVDFIVQADKPYYIEPLFDECVSKRRVRPSEGEDEYDWGTIARNEKRANDHWISSGVSSSYVQ